MLETGGHPDLALEPLGAERGGELGVEHLERDRAVVLEVARQEDRRHPAAAELPLEGVVGAEPGLELGAEVGHHAVPSTSFRNRGLFRSGSKFGSTRSQPGER